MTLCSPSATDTCWSCHLDRITILSIITAVHFAEIGVLGRVEARGEDGCEARLAAYDEGEAGEDGCEKGDGDGGEGPREHFICSFGRWRVYMLYVKAGIGVRAEKEQTY